MKYTVQISETLQKNIEVEAESRDEAERLVNEQWSDGIIVLYPDNFTDVKFDVVEAEQRDTMKVLILKPDEFAIEGEIGKSLEEMQAFVGGSIEPIYPFDDEVAIVGNEEGKLLGFKPNRALRYEDGEIADILCGDQFICGLGESEFISLSPDLMEKYKKIFNEPERFFRMPKGEIEAFKISALKPVANKTPREEER